MPRLTSDCLILFESPEELLNEYDNNLKSSGLFVTAEVELPIREKLPFVIAVEGTSTELKVIAEVVYAAGDKLGMQVHFEPMTERALDAVVKGLRAQVGSDSEREREPAAPPMGTPGAPGRDALVTPPPTMAPENPTPPPRGRQTVTTPPPHERVDVAPPEAASTAQHSEAPLDHQDPAANPLFAEPTMDSHPGSPPFGLEQTYEAPPPPMEAPEAPAAAADGAQPQPTAQQPPPAAPAATSDSVPQLSVRGIATGGKESREFETITPLDVHSPDMRELPLLRLVATISAAQLPLTLEIPLEGDDTAVLDFNIRGNLVSFRRQDSALDLLERLERDNKLERKRKERVIEGLGDNLTDRGIITMLVERRQIRVQDYWMTLRTQATDTLNAARQQGRVEYTLKTAVITRRTGIPFGMLVVPWMDVALRELSSDAIEEELGKLWFSYPSLNRQSRWPLHTLGLDPQSQTFFEESLNGCVTLDHVRKTSPLGIHRTKRLFLTMLAMGLIQISEEPAAEAKVLTPEQQIFEELERRTNATRFDQLGVHWSDHPRAYPKALERVKREFGPESKWHHFHPETVPTCNQIIKMAEAAKVFLSNKEQRVEHRNEQITRFQQQVSANLMFKQAELMAMRQEYQAARQALEVCLEMDPRREYQELRARI